MKFRSRGGRIDVLLAPVFESFLEIREAFLAEGGFVVGPVGVSTAESLFDFGVDEGTSDPMCRFRYTFNPLLAGVIYESHVSSGEAAFR